MVESDIKADKSQIFRHLDSWTLWHHLIKITALSHFGFPNFFLSDYDCFSFLQPKLLLLVFITSLCGNLCICT